MRIVPVAVAVSICALPEGFDSVTVKPSSGSIVRSPLTLIVINSLVSLGAKVTVPLGSAPPKSAALARSVPLPVTA